MQNHIFIDSSSRYFIQSYKEQNINKVEINNENEILLDGKKYGFIKGFDLIINKNIISYSLFSITHVKKSIRNMIAEKISTFLNAPNDSLSLGEVTNINFKDDINISIFCYF